MKKRLGDNQQQEYFLCDPWEYETLKFSDASSALAFLGKFKHEQSSMNHMRKLLAQNTVSHDVSQFDDKKVIELLSQHLAAGSLKVISSRNIPSNLNLPVAVDTPPAETYTPPPEQPSAAQPTKQEDNTAQIAQTATFKEAAASGTPFCQQ